MTASMRLTVTFTQTSLILTLRGKYCTRARVSMRLTGLTVTFTKTSLILTM
jgi:hypothetical protein